MANQKKFLGLPILSWAIDDWEQFNNAIAQERPSFDLSDYIEQYRRDVYQPMIDMLFSGASIKLNLGGDSEKVKIITSEKPSGIFDFSLASKGLYRVQEYYSQRLAEEFPEKFSEYDLAKGVVPNNLVKESIVGGKKTFYYEDTDGYFILDSQQKGTAAIDQKIQGAKLKYATKTKKVYLNYKRKGGKVKYVEIYSIFYFSVDIPTVLRGDLEFAIRHIPAMMVADYLEKMGVMTRIYMTRFVELNTPYYLKETTDNGNELPMCNLAGGASIRHRSQLFVLPIIAKDFGEEVDKSKAFMISSSSSNKVYEILATYAQRKEVRNEADIYNYGNPIFNQEEYFVGIERYRNKYLQYVEKGIFKSKEILPEAMLFFHDMTIANYMHKFCINAKRAVDYTRNVDLNPSLVLVDDYINPFFSWWMKLSANTLKDKINIINSNELVKDITSIKRDAEANLEELTKILNDIPDTVQLERNGQSLKDYLRGVAENILTEYGLTNRRFELTFKSYITKITNEITTYAEGMLYATDDETAEKREDLVSDVILAVSSL